MSTPKPDLRDPRYVAYAHLSNDVAHGVTEGVFVDLGTREAIAEHLWDLGYRKPPCDITPDGWCAVHSTGDGPVYCTPEETP